MTTVKKVVGSKKAKKVEVRRDSAVERLARSLESDEFTTVPLMLDALICAVDHPKLWGAHGRPSSGMGMSTLNTHAKKGAWKTRGSRCYFCSAPQKPVEDLDRISEFHPEYKLCPCMLPKRNHNYDYVEGWDTADGRRKLIADVEAGRLSLDAPLYQFSCVSCEKGPHVHNVRSVYSPLMKHGAYKRRKFCEGCFKQYRARAEAKQLKVSVAEIAGIEVTAPKEGPAARSRRYKHKNKGPAEKSLPPLDAVLTVQQLDALDKKALELANAK